MNECFVKGLVEMKLSIKLILTYLVMEDINLKLRMSPHLDYPQRQTHPLTIHHLCALDPNSACYPDKQTQHTQADTKEEPGPGSYYGTHKH